MATTIFNENYKMLILEPSTDTQNFITENKGRLIPTSKWSYPHIF